ncbi:MAG: hypothetical protein U0263_01920 [Polyangiaceae bacterium]
MSDELAHDLLWQADGHLTDVALTALADGEVALLSPAAASHAEECDACARRLGDAALFSTVLSEELAPVLLPVREPRQLPVAALLAAFALAIAGSLPVLIELPRWLLDVPRAVLVHTPLALRVAASFLKVISAAGPSLLLVWVTTTLVLAGFGLWVARSGTRQVEWKEAHR